MRKNPNKSFYHYRLDFTDGSFKRYMTIKDIENEFNISNFTIHKCIREEKTPRKCPDISRVIKEKQSTYIMIPNIN